MRAVAVWLLGTTYVLAALAGSIALVWAADHDDNSPDPTHWAIGAVVVSAPLALYIAWAVGAGWLRERLTGNRWRGAAGLGAALMAAAALAVGAQAVIADASACGDDDCVRLVAPVAIVCLLGAWTVPWGLATLRRLRYPMPLMSAALVALAVTLAAGLAAVVQRTRQEDDFADLAIAVILLVWVLPAVVAGIAIVVRRGPIPRARHRSVRSWMAAGYLVGVGIWFIALPFAAGVDSDARPVLLAVVSGPGAVLLARGVSIMVSRSARATRNASARRG